MTSSALTIEEYLTQVPEKKNVSSQENQATVHG
jgi:hypothetical protein